MFDGSGPPKMLEYNADTPTTILEASVVQWECIILSFNYLVNEINLSFREESLFPAIQTVQQHSREID